MSAIAQEHEVGGLRVLDAWSRALPPISGNGAAYVVIENRGDTAERLVSIESPAASRAELHQHTMKDGLMKMRRVSHIDVPAGGRAVLEPGGYHIMLIDLREPLVEGNTFALTLHFEPAGSARVTARILSMGAKQ